MAFRPFTHLANNVPEIGREYMLAVGALTLAWSHLELALDLIIGVDAHLSGSKKRMPVSFQQKTKRIIEMLKAGQAHVHPYEGELRQVAVLSMQTAERRHPVVHGALLGTLSDVEMKLMRLVRKAADDDLEEGSVTLHEMWVIMRMIGETAVHAYNVVLRMVREHVPEAKDFDIPPQIDVTGFQWPAVHRHYKKTKR